MEKNLYLNVGQTAQFIGVTRQTVSRWIKGGLILAETVGGCKLISIGYIKKQRCPTCGHWGGLEVK